MSGMSDKELAARAVGHEYDSEKGFIYVSGFPFKWNPLTDYGDALHLAVILCFTIKQWKHSVEIKIGGESIYREVSNGSKTRLEMTRRAIVRAAAILARAN